MIGRNTLVVSCHQFKAEVIFERADLTAGCTWRHVEITRRVAECAVAHGRFKGLQRLKARQVAHVPDPHIFVLSFYQNYIDYFILALPAQIKIY